MTIEIDQPNGDVNVTSQSISEKRALSPTAQPAWLNRARIGSALVYILFLLAYLIFIIVCIVVYPRCEPAPATPWWTSNVFLRVSSSNVKFNNISQSLEDYKTKFKMQTLWLGTVLPLSDKRNPMNWKGVNSDLGGDNDLADLIRTAHENDVRIVVDYPLNQLSVQSNNFLSQKDSYFVWNDQGNTSNWLTVDNATQSAWAFDNQKRSFYLHQFSGTDGADVNYRNNRVLNELIDAVSHWNDNYELDGLNLQGISYAYEDYQYENETSATASRTRHLEEDYLLLARLRQAMNKSKILLLDSIDSLATSDEQLLSRYYGDSNGHLGGVQMASLTDYAVLADNRSNLTSIFARYSKSIFYGEKQPLIWSSHSMNSKLNEAFYAVCLFHTGSISIDVDRVGAGFSSEQLTRLRQLIELTRTSDVFRVGRLEQKILPMTEWLTVERARRGSKHHMIIVNFGEREESHQIELTGGLTSAVEVLLTNMANPGSRYETNALINMKQSIQLQPYDYLIIRWSPTIQGLGVIF